MDPSSSSSSESNHNPGLTRGTWAKRTGFKSNLSGESISDADTKDLEMGSKGIETQIKLVEAPDLVGTPNPNPYPNPKLNMKREQSGKERVEKAPESLLKPPIAPHQVPSPKSTGKAVMKETHNKHNSTTTSSNNNNNDNHAQDTNSNIVENGSRHPTIRIEPVVKGVKGTSDVDTTSLSQDSDDDHMAKHSHIKYEIRETPGYGSLVVYGVQHFISIIGSLVLIPLVVVPAMGGDDKDTAYVVSTVLLVSGISTLLHSSFGSRLPLVQGSSFVYLAPALAIANSSDFASIGNNRFKETMRELQGSILVASIFQMFLGYSGLMTVLLRSINPVVVAPTVAAVGLSFFTYGFPVVGTCIEIGVPQIVIIIFFALYLRKISIMGHRIFQVYAVPLGLAITWAYAFILTAIGNYDYTGCDFSIPSSNILSESCQAHAFTMKHCRTDTFSAFKTTAWIRFPYPLQWGAPTFHYKSSILMIVVSIIASVDSVGTYHASSLLVASRAPTAGVVSRGIGLEGVTSTLASLWGIGTGCTTLTENVHTIAVTKMGSRRAVEFGSCVLIILSLIGKVGAFIASIPQVIVAGLLCVMWAMLTALGLSNLRYSETGSSRNVVIVGLALFFSLSIPTFFQDYGVSPDYVATTSSYLQPYAVASHGPFNTSSIGLNFILNTLMSMNMVIAFVVAFILDNTVPGSKQERGVYVWLNPKGARDEPAVAMDYGLPFGLGRCFQWFKWVGL